MYEYARVRAYNGSEHITVARICLCPLYSNSLNAMTPHIPSNPYVDPCMCSMKVIINFNEFNDKR